MTIRKRAKRTSQKHSCHHAIRIELMRPPSGPILYAWRSLGRDRFEIVWTIRLCAVALFVLLGCVMPSSAADRCGPLSAYVWPTPAPDRTGIAAITLEYRGSSLPPIEGGYRVYLRWTDVWEARTDMPKGTRFTIRDPQWWHLHNLYPIVVTVGDSTVEAMPTEYLVTSCDPNGPCSRSYCDPHRKGPACVSESGTQEAEVGPSRQWRVRKIQCGHPLPTPTPSGPCTCLGDANKDGVIDTTDFATVQANFGRPADPVTGMGDANCNGFVNSEDFATVQEYLGQACPWP